MICSRTHCHNTATDGYRMCARCRARHRAYMRHVRGPARVSRKAKARTWLAAGPRTTAQLAELLGISRDVAATLHYQIRREGR